MFRKKEDRSLNNDDRQLKSEVEDLEQPNQKKPWEPMRLTYTGDAKDVVQGGGGKSSTSPSDPGEPKKPSGQS